MTCIVRTKSRPHKETLSLLVTHQVLLLHKTEGCNSKHRWACQQSYAIRSLANVLLAMFDGLVKSINWGNDGGRMDTSPLYMNIVFAQLVFKSNSQQSSETIRILLKVSAVYHLMQKRSL